MQTELEPLSRRYDVVVANPPYMGSKNMNKWLGDWVKKHYKDVKGDLFSCFMTRNVGMGTEHAQLGFMTPYVWMFIGTYEKLRKFVIQQNTITSLIQLEYSGFSGATVPICTFTLQKGYCPGYRGGYVRLSDFAGADQQAPRALEALADADCGWFYRADAEGFGAIPGSPIAYWATDHFIDNCREGSSVSSYACFTGSQNITADNAKYVRFSWEVSLGDCSEQGTWVPYAKGGDFRRWFGNIDSVVNWSTPARSFYAANKTSNLLDNSLWYSEGITYTDITSGKSHFRYLPSGCVFDKAGPSIVCFNLPLWGVLGLFNSSTAQYYFDIFNPTLHLQTRDVKAMPIKAAVNEDERIQKLVVENVRLSQLDWDSFECSKGFKRHPLF
ncbi:Eco57I restriction-modification methylase domain-containing protein [Slackia isoflavoniconvertens]|uniref:Eco57I restriction-modification methylase domain-containing protein n=1 Tax=Slackia isoflavoniconvertens TaxID=572010 RepID=UPI003AAC51D8